MEFTNYHGTLWNTLFGKLVTCHLCIENKMFGSKANATSSLEMWFGILIFYLHDQNLFVYRLLSELKLEVKTTQNLKFVFCPPLEPMPPGEPVTGNTDDHIYFSDNLRLTQSSAAESTWENIFHKYFLLVLRLTQSFGNVACTMNHLETSCSQYSQHYIILDGRLFYKWNWEWFKSWNTTTTDMKNKCDKEA